MSTFIPFEQLKERFREKLGTAERFVKENLYFRGESDPNLLITREAFRRFAQEHCGALDNDEECDTLFELCDVGGRYRIKLSELARLIFGVNAPLSSPGVVAIKDDAEL